MVNSGCSADCGSWKMYDARLPLTRLSVLRKHVFTGEQHEAARDESRGRLHKRQERKRRHRFSAAGFADEPETFAFSNRERNRFYRLVGFSRDPELHAQCTDRDNADLAIRVAGRAASAHCGDGTRPSDRSRSEARVERVTDAIAEQIDGDDQNK